MTIGLPMVRRTRRVLVMAAVVSVSALGGTAAARGMNVTPAAANPRCTHGTAHDSDGIRTWKYVFVDHHQRTASGVVHHYKTYLRVGGGPWQGPRQDTTFCKN